MAHRIRGKVEIVEVMSRLRFSILASFVPNEAFGPGLGGVGYGKLCAQWVFLGWDYLVWATIAMGSARVFLHHYM